jgi:hypothetical protein
MEARVASALKASQCHHHRTGRLLYITEAIVAKKTPFEELEEQEQCKDPSLRLPPGFDLFHIHNSCQATQIPQPHLLNPFNGNQATQIQQPHHPNPFNGNQATLYGQGRLHIAGNGVQGDGGNTFFSAAQPSPPSFQSYGSVPTYTDEATSGSISPPPEGLGNALSATSPFSSPFLNDSELEMDFDYFLNTESLDDDPATDNASQAT